MYAIFRKEINTFFSSIIGYIVLAVFLVAMWLILWIFPNINNIVDNKFATLEPLFSLAPQIFTFLIPMVTMRSFAEEQQSGTIELLATRPLRDWDIILGKFLANWLLIIIALLPTFIYYISVYQLGSPKGNLDVGATIGSYIGLLFLSGVFVAIGLLASSVTNNQIVAGLLGILLCFVTYSAFDYMSRIPIFIGKSDDIIQMFGINYHYNSISRGIIVFSDVVYFLSVMALFLNLTHLFLEKRKWA